MRSAAKPFTSLLQIHNTYKTQVKKRHVHYEKWLQTQLRNLYEDKRSSLSTQQAIKQSLQHAKQVILKSIEVSSIPPHDKQYIRNELSVLVKNKLSHWQLMKGRPSAFILGYLSTSDLNKLKSTCSAATNVGKQQFQKRQQEAFVNKIRAVSSFQEKLLLWKQTKLDFFQTVQFLLKPTTKLDINRVARFLLDHAIENTTCFGSVLTDSIHQMVQDALSITDLKLRQELVFQLMKELLRYREKGSIVFDDVSFMNVLDKIIVSLLASFENNASVVAFLQQLISYANKLAHQTLILLLRQYLENLNEI